MDKFVKTSGYHRKHAIALSRGKRIHLTGIIRRPRAKIYTEEDIRTVFKLLKLFDYISFKRLRATMDATLPTLRRQGHWRVSAACYKRLLKISPAIMDRLRAAKREFVAKKRIGFTNEQFVAGKVGREPYHTLSVVTTAARGIFIETHERSGADPFTEGTGDWCRVQTACQAGGRETRSRRR